MSYYFGYNIIFKISALYVSNVVMNKIKLISYELGSLCHSSYRNNEFANNKINIKITTLLVV